MSRVTVVFLLLSSFVGLCFAAEPATTPIPPSRKVLVIARVPDMNRRGMVEDAFRAEFAALGLEVLTSVGEMGEDDFASPDALKAKIKALGVDGVFGLVVEMVDASVGSGASVSVGVAAPAHAGYGYGPYGYTAYVGATKQLGADKVTAHTTARLMFYNQPGQPAWDKVVKNSFDQNDLDVTAAKVAKQAVRELKKKKLVAENKSK